MKKALFSSALVISAGFAWFFLAGQAEASREVLEAPAYDGTFWTTWGDGQAELAGYDLVFPRYGELRKGTAVSIVVTEPFLEGARVKADRPGAGSFKALKLNLVEDFQTGVYDYNTMTSAFVRLENPLAGTPSKVSYSAQEWCGQAYNHLLFDKDSVRETSHSYFEGEADQDKVLSLPGDGVSEDVLFLWARGLAAPQIAPGKSRAVSLLPSLKHQRLKHKSLKWGAAKLQRAAKTESLQVPAGKFTVRRATVTASGVVTTYFVEDAAPHRVVKWERTDGYRGELKGSARMKYWELHDNGQEKFLKDIGL